MPLNYYYVAHDRQSGKEVKGTIPTGSQAEAIALLKKNGLLPISVKEVDALEYEVNPNKKSFLDKISFKGACYASAGCFLLSIGLMYVMAYLTHEVKLDELLDGYWWGGVTSGLLYFIWFMAWVVSSLSVFLFFNLAIDRLREAK